MDRAALVEVCVPDLKGHKKDIARVSHENISLIFFTTSADKMWFFD